MGTPGSRRKRRSLEKASGCCEDGRQERRSQDMRYGAGKVPDMWGGSGMSVRSNVISGCNQP